MNIKSRWWKVSRNVFLFLISTALIWIVFHHVMKVYEQKTYPPLGQLVEIDGKDMHVYTKGNGENTVVLLSGLGTSAPLLDFEPLINEMAKHHKVVVVENFGYGWSDLTNKERTVENIVEEIRMALKKANIEGPYILMPHSISGIYGLYYAYTYPKEVKAVVGIDFTLPQALEYFNEPAPTMPKYLKYIAPLGIVRLALYIMSEDFLPLADDGTYSKENLQMTKAISAWNSFNKNVVEEANQIEKNIKKINTMTFPPEMPVLIFTTDEDNVNEEGKNNVTFYRTQLTKHPASEIVTLEGHHYLHWTRYKEMSERINEFSDKLIE
ncbi:alpha/beta fold hydrolase [Pseudogracilibacillus sp. SO30301A]|uniref:alpha/beta fold hydrolase n=1 Tax=Pseudogracilibacillus sp. SO30301A TaxID=3098291 RepID=UPI00300DC4C3